MFGGAQPSHKFEWFWNASYHPDEKVFNTVKWAGPCLGEHDHPFIWTLLNVCITSKRNDFSTPRNELGRDRGCWGARPSHKLECFYMAAEQPYKKFFNTVNRTGPCLGEHGPAISSNVFEKLHTIQIKKVVNTVKWAGPYLGEHDHPFIWTLLNVCTTSKRNEFSTPRNDLGRDRGCWGARPSHELECFYMVAKQSNENVLQHRERNGPCLGEHNPAISSIVFEKLNTIQRKEFFKTVKCFRPCLGEHDHPFIWTLLNVCTTTKRNESSTPRYELGRDRGCWGTRPNHKLECFYTAAEHPYK